MTGYPDLNFPLFNDVALALRMAGWNVINPAELCLDKEAPWSECMRRDIEALMHCDSIVMLPGYEHSRGATLELHIARELGMAMHELADLLRELPPSVPMGSAAKVLVAA